MKQSAILIFYAEYFRYKKEFLDANYDISTYISLTPLEGQNIGIDKEILDFNDLATISLKNDKIILAVPISRHVKLIIQLLFELGVSKDNIILLFGEPNYYSNENIRLFCKDIDYDIESNGEVVCKINNNRILIDTGIELGIIKEIYGEMFYNFFIPNNNITIVDIGMNIGIASIFFSQLANVKKVYSYEPFLATYNRALENFKLNDTHNKIVAHSFGLSNDNRSLEVYYDENFKGIMSTISDNSHLITDSPKVTICVKDVAEVFTQIINENPENIFVFKIDCEGGEYDILNRLNEVGLIKKIKLILLEWHNSQDKNVSDIEAILRQNNISYHVVSTNSISGMLYAWTL